MCELLGYGEEEAAGSMAVDGAMIDREGEFEKEDLDLKVGSARVLYAGPDYSIAVILNSNEPVQAGFKADYRP